MHTLRTAKSSGCPGGTNENSPAFQRWESRPKGKQVPKGRQKSAFENSRTLSSLRDSDFFLVTQPSVETLGYSQCVPSGRKLVAVAAIFLFSIAQILFAADPPPAGARAGRGLRGGPLTAEDQSAIAKLAALPAWKPGVGDGDYSIAPPLRARTRERPPPRRPAGQGRDVPHGHGRQ